MSYCHKNSKSESPIYCWELLDIPYITLVVSFGFTCQMLWRLPISILINGWFLTKTTASPLLSLQLSCHKPFAKNIFNWSYIQHGRLKYPVNLWLIYIFNNLVHTWSLREAFNPCNMRLILVALNDPPVSMYTTFFFVFIAVDKATLMQI